MMLTWGISPRMPASSSESAALLDRIEIWDTPVSHRSRSRLLASPIALQIFRGLHLAVSVEGV